MKLSCCLRLAAAFIWAAALAAKPAVAETGVTDSSIRIGMSAPFTGPNGAYGSEMRSVIQEYFDQVNAGGGVAGRKLELVALDDGYETDRAVANTKALLEKEKVFALTGYYGSSPTTESMKVFAAARTPLIGTISGADTLRVPVNRYMFHVRASYADETELIAKQLVSMGLRQFGVFYQNDGFGKSGLDGFTAALKKYKLEPTVVATVERNSLDVKAAVAAFEKARPQAIVMVTLYKPTAEFVRKLAAADVHPFLITLSPVGADVLARELGPLSRGVMITQVMPFIWNDTVPLVRDYKRMVEKVGRNAKLSYYGIEAFVNARVLVEALKQCGKQPTRERLVEVLEGMHKFDLGGFTVDYSDASHNGSKFVEMTMIGYDGKVMR